MKRSLLPFLLGALLLFVGFSIPSTVRADVAFIVILTVSEENAEAFDKLAGRMVKASAKDEGLLVYEFARTGTTVYGYERYADEAAHDRHEAILEPFLAELSSLAEFNKIVTLTPLSEEKTAAMKALGAVVGSPVAGIAQGTLSEKKPLD